jgi:hypothetical protein
VCRLHSSYVIFLGALLIFYSNKLTNQSIGQRPRSVTEKTEVKNLTINFFSPKDNSDTDHLWKIKVSFVLSQSCETVSLNKTRVNI